MRSAMILTVEFLGGTSITDAITEAKEKANVLDVVYIEFKFNGLPVSVSKTSSTDNIQARYREVIKNNSKLWVVE